MGYTGPQSKPRKSIKEICCVDWPSVMGFERPLWHSLLRPRYYAQIACISIITWDHIRTHYNTLCYCHTHRVRVILTDTSTGRGFLLRRSVHLRAIPLSLPRDRWFELDKIHNNKNHIKLWHYKIPIIARVQLWVHGHACLQEVKRICSTAVCGE